ncbi:MAG: LytTR family DNA-binding domain-containing protein [Prevotella sp.]|nr:LytTR family DNA-binding domain-containing protein [Alistipes senegalensis]MCM1357230.1 LytTR family DNA-binding domain-containing protein [Prevotella sp.]MCM1472854.1 LytTR family DNA-binding domain-containing protein [Muribaculaceae bacterium]
MLKIAIVDDEQCIIEEIKDIVISFFREQDKSIEISCFTSGEEIVSYHHSYDLIFLDIQMQGMDGIDTAVELRKICKKAVMFYVTNYSNEMARSFSVHPFAFIEKPINKTIIRRNLQDYMDYVFKEQDFKSIQFETMTGMAFIRPEEILYFEYIGNRKIRLVCDTIEFFLQNSIKNIYSLVKQYGFMKPHQSFIVNPDKIKAVFELYLLMIDNTKIPIPLKKKKAVKAEIEEYLCKQFEEED